MKKIQMFIMFIAVAWLLTIVGCDYLQAMIDPASAEPAIVDRTEQILEGITTIAPTIAPWTGPAAPVILIISNLLTGVLTRIRARRTAVNAVAAPIEAARDRAMEQKLSTDGKKYIVIDAGLAKTGHMASKVNNLISSVTA